MKTNFSQMNWDACEIIHNNAYEYSDKCIICIPVYKSKLSNNEKASFNQLCKIIKNSYEICLICPDNIDLNEYINIAYSNNTYLSFLFPSSEYFKSTETYSYMCETSYFYECFKAYEYMFIYQLDGWIFTNYLDYYINLKVDYIGSPWKFGTYNFNEDTIGNGGVSLRRVQKFIDICKNLSEDDYKKEYVDVEDLFFCKTLKRQINLKLPNLKNASNFSLTNDWNYFIRKYNERHLPMCLHKWDKNLIGFEKYINLNNIKNVQLIETIINANTINHFVKQLKIKNFVKSISKPKPIIKTENVNHNTEQKSDNVEPQRNIKTNNTAHKTLNWSNYISNYYNGKKYSKIEKTAQKNTIITNYIDYICKSESNQQIINDTEKIVVTITSWPKRIKNLHYIIQCIMQNTLQPDVININLSIEEFPNKEKDLPIELQDDIKQNNKIQINWLLHNTKVWKKLIPTIYKYPNDVIIAIDDDFVYPNNLIETLYNDYVKYNKKYPISGNRYQINNVQYHCGCASLVKKEFIEPYFYTLNNEIYNSGSSDVFYTYCAKLNGIEYKQSSIEFFLNMKQYNPVNAYSSTTNMWKTGNACEKIVREKINKDNEKHINVALCAIAKNENLYIREWVEWYKNIGISKIFLYDNNEIDGEHFEDVINDYITSGFVKLIDVRGIEKGLSYDENDINLQPKSYFECYETYGNEYDWMCFFDIDEFLNIDKNISDYLKQKKFENYSTIIIPWLTFSDNEKLYYENIPVMKRFTSVSKKFSRYGVKSIVRTKKNIFDKHHPNMIHTFILKDENVCNTMGNQIIPKKGNWYLYSKKEYINSDGYLNHYKTKTLEEFIKRHLGRHWGTGHGYTQNALNINDLKRRYFEVNNQTIEKNKMFEKYANNTKI